MLYELCFGVGGSFVDLPGVGLLKYISFRSVAAAITAFLIAWVAGGRVIRWLGSLGLREDTDKTGSPELAERHKDKRGTPTMGGLLLLGAMLGSALVWLRFDSFNRFSWAAIVLVAWFGAVGLWDDWIKLRVPGRKGLSKKAKQGLLTLGAVAAAGHLLLVGLEHGPDGTVVGPHLFVPLFKEPVLALGWGLGLPFVVLAVLVLTGSANAVNLTDGLDGLAIGCVISATTAFAAICYFVGHRELADYLLVPHVAGAGEMTVLLGALLGASLGFLWYNAAPAQVFMGDVGSLALGGALGYAAIVTRAELVLPIVGGVFVAEALSVIVQVFSVRTRGKRVFRCAPIHHHFQFAGVPETRIVTRTWVLSALLALGSLALFKVR